jgi:hypothetical protein
MLLLVARQQKAPMKSLSGNYVTGFLWVPAVTIAMQQLSKRTLNNGATLFPWGLCRGVILKTIGATEQPSLFIKGGTTKEEKKQKS